MRAPGRVPETKDGVGSGSRESRFVTGLVVVLLLLSLAIRVRNLSSPLTEDHAFRQTQTAITVWTFVTEGMHPIAYQTPVFGPPWRLPMEFPIFQIAAAVLVRAGVSNIDVACRIANLLFFYLSAAFLYGSCRERIRSSSAAVCIVLAYVWLPFDIFWSRTAMPDFAAVAFALAYLYYFSRWLARERALDFVGAVACGCLMFLAKLTNAPMIAVTMAWMAWACLRNAGATSVASLWRRKALLAGIGLAAVVPAVTGVAWTSYADAVRRASPATEWLAGSTSTWNGWNAWNFGTWSQRAIWANWVTIITRIETTFLPAGLVVLALLGLWRAARQRADGGDFVLTMALGAFAAVAVFFNLFWVHSYYSMELAPAVAIAAGFGLNWVCFEWLPYPRVRLITALVALALLQWAAQPYFIRAFNATYADDFAYQVGLAIASVTPPDERVVIENHDWSPDFLYYARRKGLMWRGSIVDASPEVQARMLGSDNFTTLVCLNHQSFTARFWPHRTFVREIGPVTIYKVSR